MWPKKGFTLVELMIVVLILGALVAIAIPRIRGATFTAGVNACRKNVDTINSQIELYHSRTNKWPPSMGNIIGDPNYFPDGPPKCPFNKTYKLVQTDGKNRVPEHVHLDIEMRVLTDRILNRN